MSYTLKDFMYGNDLVYLHFLDTTLHIFDHSDCIDYDTLYGYDLPPEFESTLHQLDTDGMIIRTNFNICITLKGKMMIRRGGYKREKLLQRIQFFTIIIGSTAAIIGIIIQLSS